MEHLGEALGQPVGQRLQQDVANNRRWSSAKRFRCGSSPWIPTANPPIQSSPSGADEVGKAHVRPALTLLHLLAKEGQANPVVAGEDEHIVAFAPAAPQADGALAA